jgi:hypothetical protein
VTDVRHTSSAEIEERERVSGKAWCRIRQAGADWGGSEGGLGADLRVRHRRPIPRTRGGARTLSPSGWFQVRPPPFSALIPTQTTILLYNPSQNQISRRKKIFSLLFLIWKSINTFLSIKLSIGNKINSVGRPVLVDHIHF